MKKTFAAMLTMIMALSMAACGGSTTAQTEAAAEDTQAAETEAVVETEAAETEAEAAEEETIVLAAAASLKYVFDEQLIPMYEEAHPGVTIEATYDSSGKLQTQIEEGADWDVFFSAGTKQMNALVEGDLVSEEDVINLLANELVLIVPVGSELGIQSVEDITKAATIAIGDPADVPVGQYTQKTLEELELWETIQSQDISYGTNVTEVLTWVAEGSADCGFTYRTDAYQRADDVEIVEGLAPATYPISVLKNSSHRDAAAEFVAFLTTEEAMEQFVAYGFSEIE